MAVVIASSFISSAKGESIICSSLAQKNFAIVSLRRSLCFLKPLNADLYRFRPSSAFPLLNAIRALVASNVYLSDSEHPNRVWTGDITYVWTTEGWLYLAVILGLYSRLVIGWAMGHQLTVELAEQALTMALANQNPLAGLLHHTDRGSQYAATSYQLLLTTHGIATACRGEGTAGTTPVWRASSERSRVNSCTIGTTPPVKTRNGISSSTLRCSIIGSAGIRPLAITPRPSTKRGRRWLNWVSRELGEGQSPTARV